MKNPILASAAAFFVALHSEAFPDPGPDPIKELQKKIMNDVKDMIAESTLNNQYQDLKAQLTTAVAEVAFIPEMLNEEMGLEDLTQTQISYFLGLAVDLSTMSIDIMH